MIFVSDQLLLNDDLPTVVSNNIIYNGLNREKIDVLKYYSTFTKDLKVQINKHFAESHKFQEKDVAEILVAIQADNISSTARTNLMREIASKICTELAQPNKKIVLVSSERRQFECFEFTNS